MEGKGVDFQVGGAQRTNNDGHLFEINFAIDPMFVNCCKLNPI